VHTTSLSEWPHEKQGETSSLRRMPTLSGKNIKVLNDGVFCEEEILNFLKLGGTTKLFVPV